MERGRSRPLAEGDNPIPHSDFLPVGEKKSNFKD